MNDFNKYDDTLPFVYIRARVYAFSRLFLSSNCETLRTTSGG